MNDGLKAFQKMLFERRASRLSKTAEQYAHLPDNIRASIARVGQVENARLDAMTPEDRAKLFKAVKELRKKIDSAYIILLAAQTLAQE